MNGLYESFSIIILFPLIVWLGASGSLEGKNAKGICRFLGDISYPIYITHYALIYTYTAWVVEHKYTIKQAYPVGILTFVAAIGLAYLCLKLYDEPIRKWLTQKILGKPLQPDTTELMVVNKAGA